MNNIESKEKILSSLSAISDIKLAIASAIVSKGGTIPGAFDTYGNAIRNLSVGIDLSATTAVQSDVLSGKTFRNKNGEILSGTIPYIPNIIISGAGLDAVNGEYILISGTEKKNNRLWQHSTNDNYTLSEGPYDGTDKITYSLYDEAAAVNAYFWGDYDKVDLSDPTTCSPIFAPHDKPCPIGLFYPQVNTETGKLNIKAGYTPTEITYTDKSYGCDAVPSTILKDHTACVNGIIITGDYIPSTTNTTTDLEFYQCTDVNKRTRNKTSRMFFICSVK